MTAPIITQIAMAICAVVCESFARHAGRTGEGLAVGRGKDERQEKE